MFSSRRYLMHNESRNAYLHLGSKDDRDVPSGCNFLANQLVDAGKHVPCFSGTALTHDQGAVLLERPVRCDYVSVYVGIPKIACCFSQLFTLIRESRDDLVGLEYADAINFLAFTKCSIVVLAVLVVLKSPAHKAVRPFATVWVKQTPAI